MVQLELSSDLEKQLERAARAEGLSLDNYLRRELEARLASSAIETSSEDTYVGRKAAIDAIRTFASRHSLTLGTGLTLKELRDEGRP